MSGLVFHKHRIVPGHMGGTYEPSNVIRVNVAMHAFLHKCLWEEHGDLRDFHAWKMLSGNIGRAPHAHTAETKAKLRAVRLGTKQTDAAKAKVAAAQIGRTHTEETKAKIRAANIGVTKTPEHRARLAEASRLKWHSFSADKKARITAAQEAGRQRRRDAARVH